MKRRTFYHLSLLLPYIVLVIALAIALLTNVIDDFFSSPPSLEFLAGVIAFFAVSAIVWGPLYTWMVIVMLIWGRGRSTDDLRRMYLLSPVLLACSMGIPVLLVNPVDSGRFLLEGVLRLNNLSFLVPVFVKYLAEETPVFFGMAWLFMAAICLMIGYIFVGIALWVEKVMSKRGMFKDDGPTLLR